MLRTLLILNLCIWFSSASSLNLDSLKSIWNDTTQHDSIRFEVLDQIIWKGYLFSYPDSAYYFAQLKYVLAKKTENKLQLARALNTQAISLHIKGEYMNAIEHYNRCLKIFEEIENKSGKASLIHNIGHVYYDMGDTAKAMENYTNSLIFFEEIDDQLNICNTLLSKAGIYSDQSKYDKANFLLWKVLKIAKQGKFKNCLANAFSGIAHSYYLNKKYTESIIYYDSSYAIFNEIGYTEGVVACLNGKGFIFNDKGKYTHSIGLFLEVLRMSKEPGFILHMQKAYNGLYQAYKKTEKAQNALKMYELHIQMRDSINNEENTRSLIQHEYKYKYEKEKVLDDAKHLKEMNLAEEKEKRQVLITYGASGGICLTLLLSLFIFKRFQVTQQQKKAINEKNEHITDSISYARTIQESSLTSREYINEKLGEHFMLYQPRDIVSGDFYWVYELKNNKTMVVLADCTGHGVPGGFMSMLSISLLNEIVIENGITEANKVLEELRSQLIKSLNQEVKGAEALDGLDATLLVLDKTTQTIEFAAAGHTFYISRNNEVIEHKGDPYPVGYFFGRTKPFTKKVIPFEKGDMLYLTSDGFTEQFGGKNENLYGIKHFKDLILSCKDMNIEEQKEQFYRSYNNWKRGYTQIDDVCVMGIRIE